MFRPDGANLFVAGEFATFGLRQGFIERGRVLGAEFERRLIDAGKLQKHPRQRILRVGRQVAQGIYGLIEQNGHDEKVALPRTIWKPLRIRSEDRLTFRWSQACSKASEKICHPRLTTNLLLTIVPSPHPT